MRDLSKTLGFPNCPTGSSADVQGHFFLVLHFEAEVISELL